MFNPKVLEYGLNPRGVLRLSLAASALTIVDPAPRKLRNAPFESPLMNAGLKSY